MTFGNVDFGIVAGIAGGTLDVGDPVYAGDVEADTESEDNVAEWFAADASSAANCPGAIGVVHAVVGGGTASAGTAIRVRLWGLAQGLTVAGSPSAGATVYVTDAGALSTTAGTVSVPVGTVVDGAGPYAVWWSAVAGVSGGGGGSAYELPEYLVGPLGAGPGGSDPQYQSIQDAIDAAVADGATLAAPRAVRVLPGTYIGTVSLATGVIVYGVSSSLVRIEGNVSYQPVATATPLEWSELRGVTIYADDSASISALIVRGDTGSSSDRVLLFVDDVYVQTSYTSIAYAAVRVDEDVVPGVGALLTGSMAIYAAADGIALYASGSNSEVTLAVRGLRTAVYSGAQADAVSCDGGALVDLRLDPQHATSVEIIGRCAVDGATLRIGVGLDCTTEALATTNNVFDVANGGSLTLEGQHRFSAGANTTYLFGCSAGAGTVTVQGPYTLDAPATKSLYKVENGITLSGATHALEDVVETITGTATVSRNTTLALIVPASGTTFTVTLPDPDGYSRGRGLTVKHAGTSNTQDLTLARHSGGTIDGAASNRTLKHNDVLELMPDGAGEWQVRSSHLGTTPTGGGATYSVLTLHKAYTEAINAEIQCGGGVFRSAEHDNSGAAYFRCVLYTTNAGEGATVRLYLNGSAVELSSGNFFMETFSTSLVELTSGDLNALGLSNWPPSDGDLFTTSIDGDSGGGGGNIYTKALYSAELLFVP